MTCIAATLTFATRQADTPSGLELIKGSAEVDPWLVLFAAIREWMH
ncbi:MAG: hypothetical protein WCG14_01145 [Chlamydiia bacterium]